MKKGYYLGFLLLLIAITFVSWKKLTIAPVDFNSQIRPILNDKCLTCHGGVRQKSQLSFLFYESAILPAESGLHAIVPGKPKKSELINRIKHHDPELKMPLDADPLTKEEIILMERWIREGAKWADHWAYIAPQKIDPPDCNNEWCTNEIDHFVLSRLRSEELVPSGEAEKSRLLRRVCLDLTGLPPTSTTTQKFIEDNSDNAYEKLVDNLLDSPHFGERWASMWLDLARYADSRGYQKDLLRPHMWRYRDWVIHAFNEDLPFDQFTIDQLAGDLVESHSEDQLLATAFHRNTMTNDEGGTDDEEFRVTAVIDRLNTTMEVWQGTTIGCVQCHSHPYDPIRHKEYYELLAFYNNTADRDGHRDKPLANVYSPAQRALRSEWASELQLFKEQGDTMSQEFRERLEKYVDIMPGHVPVMKELHGDSMRKTHVFERGNWLVHGQEVSPDVPDFLPSFRYDDQKNRLGLAKWLVDDKNPLTSRVIVNRFWEQLFGRGLVSTLEDFGTQGEKPSHPELLDWLANKFQYDYQWSMKALLKQIVLSSTYRQSSDVTPEVLEKDPYNIYLARGPRFRLSAEQIRDQALAVSGLLNTEVYGKSVMPFQPEGVWNVIRHAAKWETDEDANQYRRALYTFWRRVSPYPSMVSFDAPSREFCVSRRIRTNTPLQALVTLNDPVYVEAAEALAQRMQEKGGPTVEDQIAYGFQLALMRPPGEVRLKYLSDHYFSTLSQYSKEMNKEDSILHSINPKLESMISVASVILNLDELIMKT